MTSRMRWAAASLLAVGLLLASGVARAAVIRAKELADRIVERFPAPPSGAERRPPVVRLEKVGDAAVVRITVVTVGLPHDRRDPPRGHLEIVGIPTTDATYFVQWTNNVENGPAMAHLADAAVPTIKVDAARLPSARGGALPSPASSSPLAVSPIGIGVGLALIALVVVLGVVFVPRRRSR